MVLRNYANAVIGLIVDDVTDSLFQYCNKSDNDELRVLTDMDSRLMSKEQLYRAIELYDECAYTTTKRKDYSLSELDESISKLFGMASIIPNSNHKQKADKMSEYWRDIYFLEKERNSLVKRNLDIKKRYLEIELDYNLNMVTLVQRNELFAKFNEEANSIVERYDEIEKETDILTSKENDLWSQLENETIFLINI